MQVFHTVSSPEIRRPEGEACHSFPLGAEIPDTWSFASSPSEIMISWRGIYAQ
jgi:hypothetical protein